MQSLLQQFCKIGRHCSSSHCHGTIWAYSVSSLNADVPPASQCICQHHLSKVQLFVCPSVFVHLPGCSSVCLYLSVCRSVCHRFVCLAVCAGLPVCLCLLLCLSASVACLVSACLILPVSVRDQRAGCLCVCLLAICLAYLPVSVCLSARLPGCRQWCCCCGMRVQRQRASKHS